MSKDIRNIFSEVKKDCESLPSKIEMKEIRRKAIVGKFIGGL